MDPSRITEEDIARVVPAFYATVRKDPMLGPIFEDAVGTGPSTSRRCRRSGHP